MVSRKRVTRTLMNGALFFAAGDAVLWAVSCCLAFLIRFDGAIPPKYVATLPLVLILFIPVKLAWHALFRLYRVAWDLVGLIEIVGVWKASTAAFLTLAGALFLLQDIPAFGTLPRGVLVLDYLLGTTLVAISRLGQRLLDEFLHARSRKTNGTRVLLVGAGAAGERILRSMVNEKHMQYRPVGFIDDDVSKHGTYVHGLKVLGGREAVPDAVRKLGVEEMVITIASAGAGPIRDIMRYAREAGVRRVRVLPSINELLAGKVSVQDLRDVNVEDLLGRKQARLDGSRVNTFLAGRTVLVTGAGGSIGSELARQLARSDAGRLLLLDTNETAIFELAGELPEQRPVGHVHPIIADVRDAEKMQRLFALWRPDVVYHAAAYKHVPLMEDHPDEAVRTNISGTLAVAEAALAHKTHTFVLISSDKAINPRGVMGGTKRAAELLMKALNRRQATRFIAVRFGNVIGSRGSVIPVLQEQIRRGGPVTITHPEMTRYFMSTREAVTLVLQASAIQAAHDIFMLDMGQPIRIMQLAEDLIRLSGLEPDKDIPIVFTGIRPGEKLHEILETTEEPLEPTELPGVFAVRNNGHVDEFSLRLALRELDGLSRAADASGVKSLLQRLIARDQLPLWFGGDGQSIVPQLRHPMPVPSGGGDG